MSEYILSLDQGTTSSRALLVNKKGNIIGISQNEFTQYFPHNGWVEHDAEEIWACQLEVAQNVLKKTGIKPEEVKAIGITNQRETTIVWDKETGKPIANAIVWQCRRTEPFCRELSERGLSDTIKKKTGLVIDAYFSASKVKWLLDNVEGARAKAKEGKLLFGTVETFLIWKLTGGKTHVTDYTNAARTMMFNIHKLAWDEELLRMFDIPKNILPEVKPSSFLYGNSEKSLFGAEIPIAGAAGDQQAALFGQLCLNEGDVKNTYGTGCFMLMNTGETPKESPNGLLTTIAWGLDGKVTYALEGSIFMAGAVMQWLRDQLGIIQSAPECDRLAEEVEDTRGVYLVSAFQGMGSPYWDMTARAGILGLSRGADKRHICRAALESIAYRTREILEVIQKDSGIPLSSLKVDGGASKSDILMQFQSDILPAEILRPRDVETTALGAAFLAGLAVGFWKSTNELNDIWAVDKTFQPHMNEKKRRELFAGWKKAVARCLKWEE